MGDGTSSWFGALVFIFFFLHISLPQNPGGSGLVAKSCPTLGIPWTVAHQVPLPMGFSRQEYWSGLPFPSPEDLLNPGIKPRSPALQADSLPTELHGSYPKVQGSIQIETSEISPSESHPEVSFDQGTVMPDGFPNLSPLRRVEGLSPAASSSQQIPERNTQVTTGEFLVTSTPHPHPLGRGKLTSG